MMEEVDVDTPESYFHRIYFEAVDLLVEGINSHFDQDGYKKYQHLESLLIKVSNKEMYQDELECVADFYGSDVDKSLLDVQLKILGENIEKKVTNIFDVRDYLKNSTPSGQQLLSQVMVIMKLVCVMPATNSSSAMRRVKSYLRSTMTQERLNHLMILHVHKEIIDSISLSDIANNFVSKCEHRLNIFGKF